MKSIVDLIYRLGPPTFFYVDYNIPPEVEKIGYDDESELSKAVGYTFGIYRIDNKKYISMHYFQAEDGESKRVDGFWPAEMVYSVDPATLLDCRDKDDLLCKLGEPDFVEAHWIDENSGEYHIAWHNQLDEEIEPPEVKTVRVDKSSLLNRIYNRYFEIVQIDGEEYVVMEVGFCEDGSGAVEYWNVDKLYSIDPNLLLNE
jgi:hypothetical protein